MNAATPSAIPAFARRLSTPNASAPLPAAAAEDEFELDEAALALDEGAAGAVEIEVLLDVVAAAAADVAPAAPVDDVPATGDEAAEEPDVPEVPEAEVSPVMYVGAATAVEGSTRLPEPQGMAEPSGWVLFAGSVVEPSEPAMVKRVVQVRFVGAAEVENW